MAILTMEGEHFAGSFEYAPMAKTHAEQTERKLVAIHRTVVVNAKLATHRCNWKSATGYSGIQNNRCARRVDLA